MWWPILQALQTRLVEHLTVPVQMGGDAQVPREAKVQLLRGPGSPRTDWDQTGRLDQTVFVELWAYNHDSQTAYSELAQLEDQVQHALFNTPLPIDPDVDSLLTLASIEPDGDAFRPSVACRLSITVKCRRRRKRTITPA